MVDYVTISHCLTKDGGESGSPTGPSESSQLTNGWFRSRCDQNPSAVKPMSEFDPNSKILTITTRKWGADYREK